MALAFGLGLLLLAGPASSPRSSTEAPPGGFGLSPLTSCAGPAVPTNFTGALVVRGAGLSPPSTANVTVELNYTYFLNYTPRGGNSTLTCFGGTAQSSTNATGILGLHIHLPGSSCTAGSCTSYLGPFGPVSIHLPSGPPAGFFLESAVIGPSVSLAWVSALSQVTLSPVGPLSVSTFDPVTLRANATDGDGRATPANVAYDWNLDSTDWTVLNGTGTPAVSLEATAPSVATLVRVWVNGSYDGTPLSVGPAEITLDAIATRITAVSYSPSTPDAGAGVTFVLNGTGAAGYAYSATFDPGLGLSSVQVACSSQPAATGSQVLGCATTLEYTSAGVASPSVVLSNGYSLASGVFPSLTVSPTLGVSAAPDPVTLYVGAPGEVRLAVASGSGSGPFGPACLFFENGTAVCRSVGNSLWTFPIRYDQAGQYLVRASVVDASRVNRSTTLPVEVFERPTLGSLVISGPNVAVGTPLAVGGPLSGGAGPISYWWNDSLPAGTIRSGTTQVMGPLNLSYSSWTPGLHVLTLTVEDALGTVVAAETTVDVEDGPAASLAIATNGSAGAIAGRAFPISLTALDGFGRPVPSFREDVGIALGSPSPGSEAWVNSTENSFRLSTTSAQANLTSASWQNGALNFTVAANSAGELRLVLASPVPLAGISNGTLRVPVSADSHRVRLLPSGGSGEGGRTATLRFSITDLFGNPISGGYVVVRSVFGSSQVEVDPPILGSATRSEVWVNYSALNGGAGTVYVLSEYGVPLLDPISVPAQADGELPILFGIAAVTLTIAAVVVLWARRARPGSASALVHVSDEADVEHRRIAEGRALLLSGASASEPRSPSELARACASLHPAPEELSEWIGSLVSEGLLLAVGGRGTEERYLLGPTDLPQDRVPRVELDPTALETALAREESERSADSESDPEPDG